MTPDGRYVVFEHDLRGLAEENGDGSDRDLFAVYRHDRLTGETTRVTPPDHHYPARVSISANGSRVAYAADPDEPYPLVPFTTNGLPIMPAEEFKQIWVRDVRTNEPILVSRGHDGQLANGVSYIPRISGDGRYVAFASPASNLAPDDPEAQRTDAGRSDCTSGSDVFVRDRVAGTTTMVSVSSATGAPGNGCSFQPYISPDGSTVAFVSAADNLVKGDRNGPYGYDLFVHDFSDPS